MTTRIDASDTPGDETPEITRCLASLDEAWRSGPPIRRFDEWARLGDSLCNAVLETRLEAARLLDAATRHAVPTQEDRDEALTRYRTIERLTTDLVTSISGLAASDPETITSLWAWNLDLDAPQLLPSARIESFRDALTRETAPVQRRELAEKLIEAVDSLAPPLGGPGSVGLAQRLDLAMVLAVYENLLPLLRRPTDRGAEAPHEVAHRLIAERLGCSPDMVRNLLTAARRQRAAAPRADAPSA